MLHRMADKVYILYWKGEGQDETVVIVWILMYIVQFPIPVTNLWTYFDSFYFDTLNKKFRFLKNKCVIYLYPYDQQN